MESSHKNTLLPEQEFMKKLKITKLLMHLYFSYQNQDYVLCLTDEIKIILIALRFNVFDTLTTYCITVSQPVHLTVDEGRIYLLCKQSVCVWDFKQIINKCLPKRVDLKLKNNPLRLLAIDSNEYIIITQGSQMAFVVNDIVTKEVSYLVQFAMQKSIFNSRKIKTEKKYLLVPSTGVNFPYIFEQKQIQSWKAQKYLEEYYKQCQSYYQYDECLPTTAKTLCFSIAQSQVYLCYANEIIILEIKTGCDLKMACHLEMRMKIKMTWKVAPLYCAIDDLKGALIYATQQRIAKIIPNSYDIVRKNIRQKQQQSSVNYLYFLSSNILFMVSSHGKQFQSRLYLSNFG